MQDNHEGTKSTKGDGDEPLSRERSRRASHWLAIAVHRNLGPGLLESAYEECLCLELKEEGIAFRRQVPLPVVYKSVRLDCGYRMDIVADNELVIEIKAAERLLPIHEAQMLTYLRL